MDGWAVSVIRMYTHTHRQKNNTNIHFKLSKENILNKIIILFQKQEGKKAFWISVLIILQRNKKKNFMINNNITITKKAISIIFLSFICTFGY